MIPVGRPSFGRALARTGAAVGAAAAVGGVASQDTRSRWYARLDKPSFQPPAEVFPVAWTALYADIAVTSAAVSTSLRRAGRDAEARAYERALALNLAVNASWTWVFFKAHRLGAATVVAAALGASSADLVRRAGRVDRRAGVALAPYAAWCGFATVLSGSIWRRNRE